MNFLAHYAVLARIFAPITPVPCVVMANALPDLLPLAAPRTRLRLTLLDAVPQHAPADSAITEGARVHLLTDKVFHTAPAFMDACAQTGMLALESGFTAMRVRRFFLAHVLTELALDAWLVRHEPMLLTTFYAAMADADTGQVAQWAERAANRPLPRLPETLARFVQSRYLQHYATDGGVAEGFNRLCARARQDTFTGPNERRLVCLTGQIVEGMAGGRAARLLDETTTGLHELLLTPSRLAD